LDQGELSSWLSLIRACICFSSSSQINFISFKSLVTVELGQVVLQMLEH
jgi:hypothetical protein